MVRTPGLTSCIMCILYCFHSLCFVQVAGTKPDQRSTEDTSSEWKGAFDKLREEFNVFRKQMQEEMNDLMDDLDRERKKRAEMEIDIDRLRRIRDKH